MNITISRVKKELEKKYDYANIDNSKNRELIEEVIKDVLSIVNEHLQIHNGMAIIKRKN